MFYRPNQALGVSTFIKVLYWSTLFLLHILFQKKKLFYCGIDFIIWRIVLVLYKEFFFLEIMMRQYHVLGYTGN